MTNLNIRYIIYLLEMFFLTFGAIIIGIMTNWDTTLIWGFVIGFVIIAMLATPDFRSKI